ncbi:MAG: hypothetical protein P8Y20_10430 [Gammaproteobacteria bacterium]
MPLELASRISGVIDDVVPDIWEIRIDSENAYAVIDLIKRGFSVTLADISRNRFDPETQLNLVILLYKGKDGDLLLPSEKQVLYPRDRLLICSQRGVRFNMEWALQNQNVLEFLVTGKTPIQSTLLRKFFN